MAYALKKQIFPVLIEDVTDNLPIWLGKTQCHSFIDIDYQTAFDSLNAVLTPPNPIQDLLDQQMIAYVKHGELIGSALLEVIEQARGTLTVDSEAEELLTKSKKRVWRRKLAIRVSLITILISLALAVFFWFQSMRRTEDLKIALLDARTGQLAALSKMESLHSPQLGLLLAIEAANMLDGNYSSFAYQSLLDALARVGGVPIQCWGGVGEISYTPDGNMLIAAGSSAENSMYSVYLWSTDNLFALPHILAENHYPVSDLEVSLGGKRVAYIDGFQDIYIWDLESLDEQPTILNCSEYPDIIFHDLAFTPDGDIFAATGTGFDVTQMGPEHYGIICFWDISDLTTPPELLVLREYIGSNIAFSSNGMTLITTDFFDKSVYLWDMENLSAPPIVACKCESYLQSLAVNPNGDFLALSDSDNTFIVNLNDISSPPLILPGMSEPTFSSDGLTMATQEGNIIYLWNPYDITQTPEILIGHESEVTCMTFSPDGQYMVSSAALDECDIRLWDLANPYSSHPVLKGYIDGMDEVVFSMDGNTLSGASSGFVQVWNLNCPDSLPDLLSSGVEGRSGTAMAYSPDGETLTTTGAPGVILFWNLNDLTSPLDSLEGVETAIDITFNPDGTLLAVCGLLEPVRIWNMNRLSDPPVVPILRDRVNSSACMVAFKPPDGEILIAACLHSLVLWDMTNPSKAYHILPGFYYAGINIPFESPPNHLAISPDGVLLATIGSLDGMIYLRDINDLSAAPIGLCGRDIDPSGSGGLSFSPDGQLLAVCNGSISVNIWHLDELSAPSITIEGRVDDFSFSPDSKIIATVSGESEEVSLWIVDFDLLMEISCQVVGRNFTQSEWDRYFPGEAYRITCSQWPSLSEER